MSCMQFAHATIRGKLAETPTLRRTSTGEPVATIRVTTNRSVWDCATREYRSGPLGHFVVVVFGEDAERVAHAQTGDQVMVVGELMQSSYTPDDGVLRYKTENLVIFATSCISVTPRKRSVDDSSDERFDQAPGA